MCPHESASLVRRGGYWTAAYPVTGLRGFFRGDESSILRLPWCPARHLRTLPRVPQTQKKPMRENPATAPDAGESRNGP